MMPKYYVLKRYCLKKTILVMMVNSSITELKPKKEELKYQEAKVIVLDDNFNNFHHVSNCLQNTIPAMSKKKHGISPSKLTPQVLWKFGEAILYS